MTAGLLVSRADVVTDAPARYAKQLIAHFSHKIEVRQDGDTAELTVGEGRGVIQVGDGVLTLLAEAPDAETLARVQDVLGRHLERFGARNELVVSWQS